MLLVATAAFLSCSAGDAAEAALADKQVALLSRALTHHPGSEDIMLSALRAYACTAPEAAALEQRWQAALSRAPSSWVLWRERVAAAQANFASFTVSAAKQAHDDALSALRGELLVCRRAAAAAARDGAAAGGGGRQLSPDELGALAPAAAAAATAGGGAAGGLGGAGSAAAAAAATPLSAGEEALELRLVQLLLSLLLLELRAGYSEQVVARVQVCRLRTATTLLYCIVIITSCGSQAASTRC